MFVRHRSLFASLTPFFIAFPCMEPAEKLPPSEAVAGQSQAPPRRHADTAPGDVDVEPSSAEAAPATSAASAPPQRLDLAALRNQALTESQATQLFDEFASAPDARAAGWTKNDVRLFLLSLLSACNQAPFVSDEVVSAVISEIQLNRVSDAISWVEFKSFCLYLHQTPLADLLAVATAAAPIDTLRARALYCGPLPIDIEYKAEHVLEWAQAAGQVERLYFYGPTGQAVVLFTHVDQIANALQTLNGSSFLGSSVTVQPYANQIFPDLAPPKHKLGPLADRAATLLAKGLVLASETDDQYHITQRLKEVDQEYKITDTASQAVKSTSAAIHDIDQKFAISHTVTSTAAALDEQYKISEKASAAKEAVLANPLVQSSVAALSGWGKSFTSSFSMFSSETQDRANEIKSNKTPGQP